MDQGRSEYQLQQLRHTLPGLHIFRAFRIALDPAKMLLGGLALILLAAGQWTFSWIDPNSIAFDEAKDWPALQSIGFGDPQTLVARLFDQPLNTLGAVIFNWRIVLLPIQTVAEPVLRLLKTDLSLAEITFAWTQLLWALIVWAIFGGAITRIAAVQFARDERIGIRAALTFSIRRFLSYFTAPLLPIVGIGIFWLLCTVLGLVGRLIPVVGDAIVGASLVVVLCFGFIMTMILLGAGLGWPLMYAAISTEERSDAFDGFSRPYSYLYGRPWQFVGYSLLALVYGSLMMCFVSAMAVLIVYLAGWGLAAGMGLEGVASIFRVSMPLSGGPKLITSVPAPVTTGSFLAGIWLYLFALGIIGFVPSYFWTASTIIYFLLRQSDDATELDEVYFSEQEPEDDLLPLVGVAASEQPIIERSPEGDFRDDQAPNGDQPPTSAEPSQTATSEDLNNDADNTAEDETAS